MNQKIEARLHAQQYIDPEMISEAFNFWFTDNEHLRSPFPTYIREKLLNDATDAFLNWAEKISPQAKKDINDEILAEKLEEIIFEAALSMVITDDEKLTIRYPFMPRIGDMIQPTEPHDSELHDSESNNMVIDRNYHKKGDTAFLHLNLKDTSSDREWETDFELPE